jgi:Tol biopolymer transport system component
VQSTKLVALALSFGIVAGCGSQRSVEGSAPDAHRADDADLDSGWIVYQAIRHGVPDLRLVRPDGSEDRSIPGAPDGNRLHPDWSPDGRWLAFDSNDPTTQVSQIYIVKPDGSDQRLLLPCEDPCYGNGGPVWSPDGTTVMFDGAEGPTEEHDGDLCFLARFDLASGTTTRFLEHPGCRVADSYVRWAPDGGRIVFDRNRGDRYAVFTASAAGTHERRITPWGTGARPVWSPDGSLIVMMSSAECDGCDQPPIAIDVLRPDGSHLRALTHPAEGERDLYPSWLPGGAGVLFSRCSGRSTCEIRAVTLDGTETIVIPANDREMVHPILQPGSAW